MQRYLYHSRNTKHTPIEITKLLRKSSAFSAKLLRKEKKTKLAWVLGSGLFRLVINFSVKLFIWFLVYLSIISTCFCLSIDSRQSVQIKSKSHETDQFRLIHKANSNLVDTTDGSIDINTGKFTAPQSGIYQVFFSTYLKKIIE